LRGDKGGRGVLISAAPKVFKVADQGVIQDIDTPGQLKKAEMFLKSQ